MQHHSGGECSYQEMNRSNLFHRGIIEEQRRIRKRLLRFPATFGKKERLRAINGGIPLYAYGEHPLHFTQGTDDED